MAGAAATPRAIALVERRVYFWWKDVCISRVAPLFSSGFGLAV